MNDETSRKTRLGILSALSVFLAGFSVFYFSRSPEPAYQGKNLSEWIMPFCRQTTNGFDAPGGPQHFAELQPARNAVRAIGTNGLPFLMAKVNYRESTLHQTVRLFANKHKLPVPVLTDPRVPQVRAIRALAVLGPAAEPVVAGLAAHVGDISIADHVIYALAGMGPAGMSALVAQYTNVSMAVRMQIAMAFISPGGTYRGEGVSRLNESSVGSDVMVEGLCRIIQDASSPLRTSAIMRLTMVQAPGTNVLAVVLPLLNDQNRTMREMAVHVLGRMRADPELVVPPLTNLLNDPDMGVQMATRAVLREYGYGASLVPDVPNRFRGLTAPNQPGVRRLY